MSPKQKSILLKEKSEILKEIDKSLSTESKVDLAKMMSVPVSILKTIINNYQTIERYKKDYGSSVSRKCGYRNVNFLKWKTF